MPVSGGEFIMTVTNNKTILKRSAEALWNKKDFSLIPEIVSPDFVFHTVMEVKGHEGYLQYITFMTTAFPDWHETIDHMVAEGDLIVTFQTITGTFKGPLMNLTPTGKKFTFKTAVLWRFKNAKVVEAWAYSDTLQLYKQIGIDPPG
jgi:C-1 hydroxylase